MGSTKCKIGPFTLHPHDPSHTVTMRDSNDISVAQVYGEKSEREAAAKLFAAAPGLLEELSDLSRFLQRFVRPDMDRVAFASAAEVYIRAARAAIAKATD